MLPIHSISYGGELELTLLDFSMLMGVSIGNCAQLEFDLSLETNGNVVEWFSGKILCRDPLSANEGRYAEGNGMMRNYAIKNTQHSSRYIKFLDEVNPLTYDLTPEDENELVRSFLFYVIRDFFFVTTDNSIRRGG